MNHGLVQLKVCRHYPYTLMIPTIWVGGKAFLTCLNRKAGHCLKASKCEFHILGAASVRTHMQYLFIKLHYLYPCFGLVSKSNYL